MSGWGQQPQPQPQQQRPYGTKPAWLTQQGQQEQQQGQGTAAVAAQPQEQVRGGPPPLPGWAGDGGGGRQRRSSGSGWDVGPSPHQKPGGGAFSGGARAHYGGGRHSGGGGEWQHRPTQHQHQHKQPAPPQHQHHHQHHHQHQMPLQVQRNDPSRPESRRPEYQHAGRPDDSARAPAAGSQAGEHHAREPWQEDPLAGRGSSRVRKGVDLEAMMKSIVGSLSDVGQREVLDTVESLRKDGSFDKLVQQVQVAMEDTGEMEKLRSLTRKEAKEGMRIAARRTKGADDLKLKTFMKHIREQVENNSTVPQRLNEAVNHVLGSAAFGELLNDEIRRREEAEAAAKEEAELAAQEAEDEEEQAGEDGESADSSSEDDEDDGGDGDGGRGGGDDNDEDGGSARVRGAGATAAVGGGGEDDSASSSDEEGGARVRGNNPTAASSATVGTGARARNVASPSATTQTTVASVDGVGADSADAESSRTQLQTGQVIEVYDELEDGWQRATVVSASGKTGAEYLVQYDGQTAAAKEVLLPGTFRLAEAAAASSTAASMTAEAPGSTEGSHPSLAEDADADSIEMQKDSSVVSKKRQAPDVDHSGDSAPAPKRPATDSSDISALSQEMQDQEHVTKQDGDCNTAASGDQGDENKASDVDDEEAEEEWLTTGSEWLGKRVARTFGGQQFVGRVVSWVPANDDGDPPLWKIKHDDGDEEDLEEYELKKGLALLEKGEKAERKKAEQKDKQMALLKQKEEQAMASIKSKRSKKGGNGSQKPAAGKLTSKAKATPKSNASAERKPDDDSSDDDAPVGKLKSGKN